MKMFPVHVYITLLDQRVYTCILQGITFKYLNNLGGGGGGGGSQTV